MKIDHSLQRFVEKLSFGSVVAIILCIPFALHALLHLPVGSASLDQWLPEGKTERQVYDRFTQLFGVDQFLLVSWEGCQQEDPRLLDFKKGILESVGGQGSLIQSITTTRDIVQSLSEPPIQFSPAEVSSRLRGFWLGENGTYVAVIQFTPLGIRSQSKAIELVQATADKVPELGRDRLHLAGTLYETHAVDEAAERSLKTLVIPSTLVAAVVAWFCLGGVRYALIVFLLAGTGQISLVAMVYYCGGEFSAVLIVLPTLVFMLTLAGAVHLVSYYKEIEGENLPHPGVRALFMGFMPCLWSTITTVIGDGSLILSQLAPIREFGYYCGAGLIVSTLILFLAFPYVVQWKGSIGKSKPRALPKPNIFERFFASPKFIAKIDRHHNVISIFGIGLLLLTSLGILQIETTTKFDVMFSPESKTVQDMNWLERNVGPLASIEVLVHFDKECDRSLVDRARCVSSIEESLRAEPEVGGVMATTTFLPKLPQTNSMRSVARRAILNGKLEEAKPTLIEQSLLAETEEGQVWRLTAKVSSLKEEDYGFMSNRIEQAVREGMVEFDDPTIHFELTGLAPVMHLTQKALLWDLGTSFASAFLMITPVMMLVSRGFFSGLLVMVPNVLPIAIVFGVMGWCGWKLDIAGILTASIALGIAVDDTLHFVSRYFERLDEGDSPRDAVQFVVRTCGNAILFTTLINCFAMLAFVWSEFRPTSQFATMMIAILSLAVIGDLLLLPALLLSPLGKLIRPTSKASFETKPNIV